MAIKTAADNVPTPAADIVSVIDSYVPLEHTETAYRGYCPFCHDTESTLVVRPDIQTWHCFGCGQGGDVYDFVAAFADVSRARAKQLLSGEPRPAAATPKPAAAPIAAEPPPVAEWEPPEAGPYQAYFLRLRRLKGYVLAAILDAEHLLAIDNPVGEDPPLGTLSELFADMAARGEALLGDATQDEHCEILFEDQQRAMVFMECQHEGKELRVLLLLHDRSQLFLARLQAASLRSPPKSA